MPLAESSVGGEVAEGAGVGVESGVSLSVGDGDGEAGAGSEFESPPELLARTGAFGV